MLIREVRAKGSQNQAQVKNTSVTRVSGAAGERGDRRGALLGGTVGGKVGGTVGGAVGGGHQEDHMTQTPNITA